MLQPLDVLKKIIDNGENSTVAFKEENAHNDSITKEIIAFLNFKGGMILFGIDDNGCISGISDKQVMTSSISPWRVPPWAYRDI